MCSFCTQIPLTTGVFGKLAANVLRTAQAALDEQSAAAASDESEHQDAIDAPAAPAIATPADVQRAVAAATAVGRPARVHSISSETPSLPSPHLGS
jgi:hypothetical protein